MMNELYRDRKQKHLFHMMKYMKYVFNDHFMIVLFFLFGGCFLYYASLIKRLTPPLLWVQPLSILLLLITLKVGKLPTFIKEADTVFLLPKETKMKEYLKSARHYAIILPSVLLACVLGILMPLLVVAKSVVFADYILLALLLVILKYGELLMQSIQLYRSAPQFINIMYLLLSAVALVFSLYGFLFVGLIISVVILMLYYLLYRRYNQGIFAWDKAVKKEEKRLLVIYRFINLFTDVPEVKVSIRRRRYLDGLLKGIAFKKENTYVYLYARHLLRSNEYSGLILRLTLIADIVLFFNDTYYLSVVIGVVMMYLLLFQLLPLYRQFDMVLFCHLYPISAQCKILAMQKIMMMVTLGSALVMALCSLHTVSLIQGGLLFLILLLEGVIYTRFILVKQVKRYID